MKKTILYDKHLEYNAKMVEYAGYQMPVEYSGLINEHLAVRNSWGVFDCSHMGEIIITGNDSTAFVNYLMSGKVSEVMYKMSYGLLLNDNGGVIDDLMCYHYSDNKNLLVVNASNKDKDFEWINSQIGAFDVQVNDLTDAISLLAVQGKDSEKELQKISDYDLSQMKMFDFKEVKLNNMDFLISRSGYTGEDGFEIYGTNLQILSLFDELVKLGVTLCGLGCRDTLRFEANMPLYGHEINEDINPYEATLGFAVDLSKDFIGKDALIKIKDEGIKRKIVGLELLDKGIARSDYEVEVDDKVIGYITTGYMIPGTNKTYALALIEEGYWEIGTKVLIRIRKNKVNAVVRNKKFLNKKYVK